jgi:hypothetical protein
MNNDKDGKQITDNLPQPIGTDALGARRYLGCSESTFKDLRRRGYLSELRKNWFLFSDLNLDVERLRLDEDEHLRQVRGELK